MADVRSRAHSTSRPAWIRTAALLFGLCCAVERTPCSAGGEVSPTEGALVEFVGSPAHPERALLAVRKARPWTPAQRVLLADVLGRAGGVGAAQALARMIDDPAARVRLAALGALRGTGIRLESASEAVRRRLPQPRPDERVVVLGLLGRIGDGRDLGHLLDALEGRGRRDQVAALSSLRALTGGLRMRTPARWKAWHAQVVRRKRREFPALLLSIDATAEGEIRPDHLAEIRRWFWIDLPGLRAYLRRWLAHAGNARRLQACGLVGDLRLGDLAEDVERLRDRPGSGEPLRDAARAALDRLGVPPRPAPRVPSTRGQTKGSGETAAQGDRTDGPRAP